MYYIYINKYLHCTVLSCIFFKTKAFSVGVPVNWETKRNETKTKSNEICNVRKRNPTKWNEICKVRKRNPTKWNEICKVRKRNPRERSDEICKVRKPKYNEKKRNL